MTALATRTGRGAGDADDGGQGKITDEMLDQPVKA
jgi:hypothetical protein